MKCVMAEILKQTETLTWYELIQIKSDALRDLLPPVQFKKREKHPRRSFTLSKVGAYVAHVF